jgi:hypothetical protein
MHLINSPLCRRYRAEKENSAHVVCEYEALATLRHTYLHSFFLDPVMLEVLSLGVIWNLIKGTGHPTFDISLSGTKGLLKRPTCIGTKRARTHLLCSILLYYILFYSWQTETAMITAMPAIHNIICKQCNVWGHLKNVCVLSSSQGN